MRPSRTAEEFRDHLSAAQEHWRSKIRSVLRERRKAMDPSPPDDDDPEELEYHVRTYLLDGILEAANWTIRPDPEGHVSLLVEAPVRSTRKSQDAQTVRFLDYLGIERDSARVSPLLIAESKRPGAKLPKLVAPDDRNGDIGDSDVAHILALGLAGKKLSGEWGQWLQTLRDYYRGASRGERPPRRVLMTNGDWLVVFESPERCFGEDDRCDPDAIVVFATPKAMIDRSTELFSLIEHYRLRDQQPELDVAKVAMLMNGDQVSYIMHGLHLTYDKDPGYLPPAPVRMKVVPMLFIGLNDGSCVRILGRHEFTVPVADSMEHHLREVDAAGHALLRSVNDRLGLTLTARSLMDHYADRAAFNHRPAVVHIEARHYEIVTGDRTHLLLQTPTLGGCPHHSFQGCGGGNVADGLPVPSSSFDRRSAFPDGHTHHCAHRDVHVEKSASPPPSVRVRLTVRSNRPDEAFCELFPFERFLCCRACGFQEVCFQNSVFRLPCNVAPATSIAQPATTGFDSPTA